MSAYNKVRGEWAGESRHLLTEILRDQWGFRGYVTSDWIWGVHDGARGVHAGLDIEMPASNAYGKGLRRRIESGAVSRAEIDESVRRIVRTKLRFLTRADPQAYPRSLAGSAAHAALAREVAEKAMVLLENDGALLPLDRRKVRTLAVVGHLADADNTGDHGSSRVRPPYTTSALAGLRDHLGAGAAVLHADGKDLAEVARVAAAADAVVVVAGTRWDEVGEYVSDDQGMRPRGPAEKRPMVVKRAVPRADRHLGRRPRAALAEAARPRRHPRRASGRTRGASSPSSAAASSRWRSGGTTSPRS